MKNSLRFGVVKSACLLAVAGVAGVQLGYANPELEARVVELEEELFQARAEAYDLDQHNLVLAEENAVLKEEANLLGAATRERLESALASVVEQSAMMRRELAMSQERIGVLAMQLQDAMAAHREMQADFEAMHRTLYAHASTLQHELAALPYRHETPSLDSDAAPDWDAAAEPVQEELALESSDDGQPELFEAQIAEPEAPADDAPIAGVTELPVAAEAPPQPLFDAAFVDGAEPAGITSDVAPQTGAAHDAQPDFESTADNSEALPADGFEADPFASESATPLIDAVEGEPADVEAETGAVEEEAGGVEALALAEPFEAEGADAAADEFEVHGAEDAATSYEPAPAPEFDTATDVLPADGSEASAFEDAPADEVVPETATEGLPADGPAPIDTEFEADGFDVDFETGVELPFEAQPEFY